MNMKIVFDVLSICLGIVSLLIVLTKFLEIYKASKNTEKLLEKFMATTEPGEFYLKLIYDGYLQTLKLQNHSKDFPDKEQVSKFIQYSTEDIKQSMKRVNETYEKFVL